MSPYLKRGSSGAAVMDLQRRLNAILESDVKVDGDFGQKTEAAVKTFQTLRHLTVDGEVGDETWKALNEAPPSDGPTGPTPLPPIDVTPPGDPPTGDLIANVVSIAASSPVMHYDWSGRGRAPPGYIKGVAASFAFALTKLRSGNPPYVSMARRDIGYRLDALAWYRSQFDAHGMSNSRDGPDTLRHLFVLLMGLGLRESSGRYCEGRDRSASNTSASSAEAGAWQQSWDSRSGIPLLKKLMDEYDGTGYLPIYREGVKCSASDLKNYGTGAGLKFQQTCKAKPDFAAQACALGLRSLRTHWGPIVRHEAVVRPEADEMLKKVQALVMEGK